MSRVLPQELKTSKVKSLDGDLRRIAEELIADKFGIEEEVVAKRSYDPSVYDRGRSASANAGCGNSFCASCYDGIDPCRLDMGQGPDFGARFGGAPSQGVRTTLITLEACYELVKIMDYKNAPRQKREFRMGRAEFDDLTRDRRFDTAARVGRRGPEIFGIPVLLQGMSTHEIELVCFW